MGDLAALRHELLRSCYRYAQAATPVQRYWRATEREWLLREIRKAKRAR